MSRPEATTIRVVDEAGSPVEEASVVVVSSSVPFPEMAMLTDAAGKLTLFLPVGRFELEARGPGGGKGKVEFEIREPQKVPEPVEIRLGPAG